MSDTGREKVTFRVSKEILADMDRAVKGSRDYSSRSGFIRELLTRGKSTGMVFNSSSMLVHNKAFEEILRYLKKEDIEKVTKKTSSIVHSFMQDKKKCPVCSMNEDDALSFLKEIYESTNMVNRFYYNRDGNELTVCVSGDNLCSSQFSDFIKSEVINVMKPWFKMKSSSETPGNVVLIFE